MHYTYSITSKGQITIPKEFREKLGLDKIGKATLELTDKGEVMLTRPKTLQEVRVLLHKPTFNDVLSKKEQVIGKHLAKKYGVR